MKRLAMTGLLLSICMMLTGSAELSEPVENDLCKAAKVTILYGEFYRTIHEAVMRNDTLFALAGREELPDSNFVDISGKTLHHSAALCNSYDVCVLLLERGADISLVDNDCKTAADYALEHGYYQVYL